MTKKRILKTEKITLSARDVELTYSLLECPPQPNARLERSIEQYKLHCQGNQEKISFEQDHSRDLFSPQLYH